MRKLVYENLRAIGDYCPNLERLDLNYPVRLELSATEADLPPKIGIEPETVDVAEAEMQDTNEPQVEVQEDVEMQDVQQTDGQTNGPADGDAEEDDYENDENDDPDADGDGEVPDDREAQIAREHANYLAQRQAELAANRRICAELDYIIKKCPLLHEFSIQWTGPQALERFYHRIPKLKALRIWDRITDEVLVATGKKCRDLERFYLDGQEIHAVTLDGLIRFLSALHTKEKSKLKRLGLYYPSALAMRGHFGHDMDDDMDDDEIPDIVDTDDENDEDDENDDDDDDNDGGDGGPVIAIANNHVVPTHVEVVQPPLHQFLDVLSIKHPFLQRLCLAGCHITDATIPFLGRLDNLQSLDISKPSNDGLSAVGITELVISFRGKLLSSLDLSRHRQMSEDDINILTGPDGLKTIRYIKVAGCPKLAGKYMVDEWVHPQDFVMEDGTWRPRDGAGKSLLEIGEGFKEQWNE
jgi:hypothetical protein